MPRIRDLHRWLGRRIRRPGDVAVFKILGRSLYRSRSWGFAITAAVYRTTRGGFVLILSGKRYGFPFDFCGDAFAAEFESLDQLADFVEKRFKPGKYVYYHPKRHPVEKICLGSA